MITSPIQAQINPHLYSTQAESTTFKKLMISSLNYHKVSGAYSQSDQIHFRTHILTREKKGRGLDRRKGFNLTAADFWEIMKMMQRIIESMKKTKVIITASFCWFR